MTVAYEKSYHVNEPLQRTYHVQRHASLTAASMFVMITTKVLHEL